MREHASTVFGEMSALAIETGSINLGQGFPDTDGPDVVKESAIRAIREGRGNQYPPAHGIPELRRAIAEHQQRFYGLEVDPQTDVVVATGASEAIAAAMLALVDDGDEVVMFSPWFDLYAAVVSLAGGTRVEVPLTAVLLHVLGRHHHSRAGQWLTERSHRPGAQWRFQWFGDRLRSTVLVMIKAETGPFSRATQSRRTAGTQRPGLCRT